MELNLDLKSEWILRNQMVFKNRNGSSDEIWKWNLDLKSRIGNRIGLDF